MKSNLQKDNILGVEEVKYKIHFGSFVRSFVFLIILQASSLSHMTLTLQKIPIGSFNLIAFELKGPYSCSYVLISFLTATVLPPRNLHSLEKRGTFEILHPSGGCGHFVDNITHFE